MSIKKITFSIAMVLSSMIWAQKITSIYTNFGQGVVAGRNIFVQIDGSSSTNTTALGITFYSNPSTAVYSLSGVGTITNGSIQNYAENRNLVVSFSGGQLVNYNIMVSKPTIPGLGVGNLSNNNIISVVYLNLVEGQNYSGIGNSQVIGNKIYYSIPTSAGTNFYISLQTQQNVKSVSGVGHTFAGTNTLYFNSTTPISFGDVTTITTTAMDGSTRTYELIFVESNALSGNILEYFYVSSGSLQLQSYTDLKEYFYYNNTSVFGFYMRTSADASVSVTGNSFITSTVNSYYNHQLTITATSDNFELHVISKDGAVNTYKFNKVIYSAEPTLVQPLDVSSLNVSGYQGYKGVNEYFVYFPAGTDISSTTGFVGLNGTGTFSIDGASFVNNTTKLNWNQNHTLTIYNGSGTLVKTYTIRSIINPVEATTYTPLDANGFSLDNTLSQFRVQFEGSTYNGTLSGTTYTVNLPSNAIKDNLYVRISKNNNLAVLSVLGVLNPNSYFNYNFTNPVQCVVYSESGAVANYTLVVNNTLPLATPQPLSTLTGFSYGYVESYNFYFNNYSSSTTTGNNIMTLRPLNTNPSNARIYILDNGAYLSVAGVGFITKNGFNTLDMTNPITVTSIAQDGETKSTYVLGFDGTRPDGSKYMGFNRTTNMQSNASTSGLNVYLTYKQGHDLSTCVPSFYIPSLATVSVNGVRQISEVTAVDLTSPKIYDVMAQDGTIQSYTVTGIVSSALSSNKLFQYVSIGNAYVYNPDYANGMYFGTVVGNNYTLTVTGNFSNHNFRPYFSFDSDVKVFVNGLLHLNYNSIYNFSSPLNFYTQAEDGSVSPTYSLRVVTTVAGGTNNLDEAEQVLTDVVLYPNPTNQADAKVVGFGKASVSVFDVLGNVVYTVSANGEATIPSSSFSKGIYFVRITSGKSSVVRKLVVE